MAQWHIPAAPQQTLIPEMAAMQGRVAAGRDVLEQAVSGADAAIDALNPADPNYLTNVSMAYADHRPTHPEARATYDTYRQQLLNEALLEHEKAVADGVVQQMPNLGADSPADMGAQGAPNPMSAFGPPFPMGGAPQPPAAPPPQPQPQQQAFMPNIQQQIMSGLNHMQASDPMKHTEALIGMLPEPQQSKWVENEAGTGFYDEATGNERFSQIPTYENWNDLVVRVGPDGVEEVADVSTPQIVGDQFTGFQLIKDHQGTVGSVPAWAQKFSTFTGPGSQAFALDVHSGASAPLTGRETPVENVKTDDNKIVQLPTSITHTPNQSFVRQNYMRGGPTSSDKPTAGRQVVNLPGSEAANVVYEGTPPFRSADPKNPLGHFSEAMKQEKVAQKFDQIGQLGNMMNELQGYLDKGNAPTTDEGRRKYFQNVIPITLGQILGPDAMRGHAPGWMVEGLDKYEGDIASRNFDRFIDWLVGQKQPSWVRDMLGMMKSIASDKAGALGTVRDHAQTVLDAEAPGLENKQAYIDLMAKEGKHVEPAVLTAFDARDAITQFSDQPYSAWNSRGIAAASGASFNADQEARARTQKLMFDGAINFVPPGQQAPPPPPAPEAAAAPQQAPVPLAPQAPAPSPQPQNFNYYGAGGQPPLSLPPPQQDYNYYGGGQSPFSFAPPSNYYGVPEDAPPSQVPPKPSYMQHPMMRMLANDKSMAEALDNAVLQDWANRSGLPQHNPVPFPRFPLMGPN